MTRIGLVPCSKNKMSTPAPAYLLYSASSKFTQAYIAAKKQCNLVFILSAKYGVLSPKDVIAPYDLYLGSFSETQTKKWASACHDRLKEYLITGNEWYSYLPKGYREPLESFIDFAWKLEGDHFAVSRELGKTKGNIKNTEGVMMWCLEYIFNKRTATVEEIRQEYIRRGYKLNTVNAQIGRLSTHPFLIKSGNLIRYKFLCPTRLNAVF